MRGCLPSSRYKKTAKCLSYLSGPFYLPVSFPLLLSQSLPFYTSFLTWGCIGLRFLFFWLIFPSILGESLWINHNPFLLVKDLIKHPAHLNLILTSLCTAFLICFPLIFQLQNRMYCKENHLFFFPFLGSSQSQITEPTVQEIVFPWIWAHSILHPIFNSPHPFLHASPLLFFLLAFKQSPWK